ncbi:MAG: signal peptidase I [Hyphomicrobiaceae bacterium]|nr:signal peptidase I [Hyphomicrobiaceae bacterium]
MDQASPDASGSKPFGRTGRLAVVAALTAVGLVTFCVLGFLVLTKKFSIVSSAMSPTLNVNEFVAFLPTWLSGEPQRGDVAAFWVDAGPGNRVIYVMRIVGLPGDRIAVKDSILQINGEAVPRREVERPALPNDTAVGPGARAFEETLPDGRSHLILDDHAEGFFDTFAETVVPPGQYFLMGDNRDNAHDSRGERVGTIARDDITGTARLIYFAYDGTGIRFDRVGTWVR